MKTLSQYSFWFVVGSQSLYGSEVLATVEKRGAEMAYVISQNSDIPCQLIYKATVKSAEEITGLIKEAN